MLMILPYPLESPSYSPLADPHERSMRHSRGKATVGRKTKAKARSRVRRAAEKATRKAQRRNR